jgi:hypothetical protein
VLRSVKRLKRRAMPSLVSEVGGQAGVVPVHSPGAPAPSPGWFMRPKSKRGWKKRAERGAAQTSTVRWVLEEMRPLGRLR